jgi:starch-binding outer membrane protein, SusD/RagB family
MKIRKKIKYAFVSILLVSTLSSCADFFNTLPLNEIVLENFYKEEADIKQVLTACYGNLESEDCVKRMEVWGEFRSDNIVAGSSAENDEIQLLKENILTTSPYTKWASFYKVINLCNTVIHYAPVVKGIDPNYTVTEEAATIAEAKAIRALCYFYLVRTFRDVPFILEPTIDDTQSFDVPATSGDSIIAFLVKDLDKVKDDAVIKFSKTVNNTTRFTRYGIYSLLADLYLWKGDYENCIINCDRIIDYKSTTYKTDSYKNYIQLYRNIPLFSETNGSVTTTSGYAYSLIFSGVGSFESLFELNFASAQSVSNKCVTDFFGTSSSKVARASGTALIIDNNALYPVTDCRATENLLLTESLYGIRKYVYGTVLFKTPSSTVTSPTISSTGYNGSYAQWIIYRFSDILLMKAEALVQQAKSDTISQKDKLLNAFTLVSAVYNRANNISNTSSDSLKYTSYNTIVGMEDLVLLERQRELMFEGKRWFDLVRMVRRDGNNDRLARNVVRKITINQSAIGIKLNSKDYIYFPYNESELMVNDSLTQNPAFVTDKTSQLSE